MDKAYSIETLTRLLAETYVLQVKTQGVHWNVTGPDFFELHKLTEMQYTELFGAVDVIAESLRALGAESPASMKELLAQSKLAEGTGNGGQAMAEALLEGNEWIAKWLTAAVDSEKLEPGTEDLCVDRIRAHQKAAWMWRSVCARRNGGQALASANGSATGSKAEPAKDKKSKKAKVKSQAKPVKKQSKPAAPAAASKPAPVVTKKETVAPKPAGKVVRPASGRLSRAVADVG